jgi:dTDP-4-amino-4,6-dideoxygalactose transaminase
MWTPVYSPAHVDAATDLAGSIGRVLERHQYLAGQELDRFEAAFATYCGVTHCAGVANGTDALEIALRALEVGPGDRVVVVANAGFYGSTAVRAIGAVPVYVDVDPVTLQMSPDALSGALAAGPAAVIATHLYGLLSDIERIMALATDAGVPVIEDCAQAHGASRNSRRAGGFGTIGCFSFYPTKNLGALGDAGALVTNDDSLATRIRRLRQYGWETKYDVQTAGGRNSRLDEIQAAVLIDRLPHLDRWNDERRAIAARYVDGLAGFPIACPPSVSDDYVAHLFVVQVTDRDGFRQHLAAGGVATDVHYPVADHLQHAYRTDKPIGSLPATELACDRVVTLPCYPGLSLDHIDHVISLATGYFQSSAREARSMRDSG